ncbi:MAG TPA: hypothetical protein VHC20_07705 [Candidatus Paceibacterota bacterium]|nr:hypothetical protein [Candidatus Paceibacterota bacterium]
MATVINDSGPDRVVTVERTTDSGSSAGWAIAVIILIAVIVGLFVWYHYHHAYVAPAQGGNSTGSINITLPGGNDGNSSSNASGGETVGNGS